MSAARIDIQASLHKFQSQPDFRASATNFFKALGYESARTIKLTDTSAAGFQKQFDLTAEQFDSGKAHTKDWKQFEFLFQFGEGEVQRAAQGDQTLSLFNQGVNRGEKNSFFFHAVKLHQKPDGYRRSELADMTRQLNRPFGVPTVVLFEHSSCLTLGVIDRRPTKSKKEKDQGKDVLEKVTLIKDIDLQKPHPAHVHILEELQLGQQADLRKVSNFDDLLKGWRATLSITELNRRFYRELANWYFWALQHVEFPAAPGTEPSTRHHPAVIRLITRLIFVWFLREKKLVPADLFNKKALDKLLNYQDKTGSTFYKAILQNLFFATLNAEMNPADKAKPRNRRFITDQDAKDKGYFVHSLYRYERFFSDKAAALALLETVPFLNGGLFECLDRKKNGQSESRIDCFSDNPKNEKRLSVPDFLFFDEHEHDIDLNETYATKRRKYKVRGLFAILNSYKFTVTENTPVEEEVALDPELLGKVFENLLASYNPETKTTARKQTGSFYTPREVVDYMVDESLIAYLGTALTPLTTPTPAGPAAFVEIGHKQTSMFANKGKKQAAMHLEAAPATPATATVATLPDPELTRRLRHLLAYNNDAPDFDAAEKLDLLAALHRCRILDPACGSGAYPMGILHKMVFVLNRLDPENKHWLDLQKQQTMQEFDEATQIADEQKREARLIEINKVFQENLHDYTRKLFLIENCIYGVDLQPIAVQISKLRFFISLVVDQKPDDSKPNRGIRPLPNLETKFVAANSLISLDEKFKGLFGHDDSDIKALEQELKKARHQHFLARTWEAKKRARDRDEKLREQLVKLIELRATQHEARVTAKTAELDGYINTTVQQLANKATAGDKAKRQKSLEQLRRTRATEHAKHLDQESVKDNVSQVGRWDPYDQNTWAAYFDTEWMFGEEVKAGFHIVIGNPPYVQVQHFSGSPGKEQEKWAKQNYASYSRTGDVYCLFYEQGIRLLRPGGVLCYITSNKWMKSGYGSLLRTFLAQRAHPLQLIDFSGHQVFESATVDTNVLLAQKPLTNERITTPQTTLACVVGNDFSSLDNLSLYFTQHAQPTCFDATGQSWVVLNEIEARIKAKIEAAGTPLKDWDVQINYGIKTGYNEAFIIDEATKDRLLKASPKSAEIIRPILRGRDIKRYKADDSSFWIIFTRHGIDIKQYPAVEKHLLTYYDELKPRAKGDKRGRKPGSYQWFEIQDNVAYYKDFDKPKIIYPEISKHQPFVYDEKNHYYSNNKTFIITGESLLFLTAFFNSRIFRFCFLSNFPNLGEDRREMRKVFFEHISVKYLNQSQQLPFLNLVNRIIAAKNDSKIVDSTSLEAEIDKLFYELYELNETEVELVKAGT